jgi:hypothetical protein
VIDELLGVDALFHDLFLEETCETRQELVRAPNGKRLVGVGCPEFVIQLPQKFLEDRRFDWIARHDVFIRF